MFLMRKILLIDNDTLMVRLMASLLEQHHFTLVHAASLAEGQRLLDGGIELIVLEASLPDGNGLNFVRRLRDLGERRPVMFLSSRADDDDAMRGLATGADDYVTKPFNYLLVIARIEAALRRQEWSQVATASRDGLDPDQRTLRMGGRLVPLTLTEFKLLEILTSRPGRAFSRDELWLSLDEAGTGGFDRAIDLHVGRLRGKIEVDTKEPRHLLTVRGVGYRWAW